MCGGRRPLYTASHRTALVFFFGLFGAATLFAFPACRTALGLARSRVDEEEGEGLGALAPVKSTPTTPSSSPNSSAPSASSSLSSSISPTNVNFCLRSWPVCPGDLGRLCSCESTMTLFLLVRALPGEMAATSGMSKSIDENRELPLPSNSRLELLVLHVCWVSVASSSRSLYRSRSDLTTLSFCRVRAGARLRRSRSFGGIADESSSFSRSACLPRGDDAGDTCLNGAGKEAT
jgi:hypothetical protein